MKIQSIPIQPHADGKSDEVLWSTKHSWSFTAKKVLQKHREAKEKETIKLVRHNPNLRNP